MFGLGRRAQLRRLSAKLKGASLQDVISYYADEIQHPIIAYDESIAELYDVKITAEDKKNSEVLNDRLKIITNENKLVEGSEKIYLAYAMYNSLSTYALELTVATKLMSNIQAVDYMFEKWLQTVPAHYVLPILFPAKCGDRKEDFGINEALRHAMIDELLQRFDDLTKTLTAEDFLNSFSNEFLSENPYYIMYPL